MGQAEVTNVQQSKAAAVHEPWAHTAHALPLHSKRFMACGMCMHVYACTLPSNALPPDVPPECNSASFSLMTLERVCAAQLRELAAQREREGPWLTQCPPFHCIQCAETAVPCE
jgi:hypothetical protein